MVLVPGLYLTATAQTVEGEHVSGRLLVQRTLGASSSAVSRALAAAGAQVEKELPEVRISVLKVPEAAAGRVSSALTQSGLFTFVEPDFIAHASQSMTPDDPDFSSQWHLTKISGPTGWVVTTGLSTVPIAVIDSGIDTSHPDLVPKTIAGWNFLTGTSNTTDDYGHGTAVSGVAAAATNNLTGVSGVAWGNPIMPLVVIDSTGSGSYSNVASAIDYAADHGVRVINISLGGTSASSALQNAVNYAWSKGAVVVAAAGNGGSNTPYYPAACQNVIAVSATDQNDNLASFSSYGSWVSLSAPGTYILTTQQPSTYGYWQGTSFSSPIVSGVAALVLSLKPGLSASALVSLLEQNTDDLGAPGWDQYFGWGRVNVYKAVQAANAGDSTPPTVAIASPASGVTVAGTISVTGTATDNVGVTSIQFLVDGQVAASGTSSPYSFSWNTANVTNGSHTLTVDAYDAAGNLGSASVSVTVSNQAPPPPPDNTPPTVTITKPTNGTKLGNGNLQIAVSATDVDSPVSQVSIYVDGTLQCTDTVSPYTCGWNTTKVAPGTHTITANAWDPSGNKGSAIPVTVTK
jgi:subtilisin family serine protease